MPGTISHALSMTTPDNTAYENRPSHWNASHALTLSATGSEIVGAFSNANGLSFGLSAGAITASHNAITTAALSNHSHGNPTLNLTNLSGTTASNSAGFTLSLSAGAGGAGDGVNILAAGTQTANTTGTVLFNNGNGISFGMSNSSVITASYTVPSLAGLLSNINVSAGTTSNNLSALTFSNSNGISFGLNGSVITGTVQTNYLTTAMASNRGSDFVQANAAFAGTSASGTIASNGISVSIGPYITTGMLSNAVTLSNIRVSGGTTSNLLSAMTFGDANGISFGLNASTMTASHNALTSQSNQNVTAGNGGFAFQTLSFSNLNGISFGTSAGSAITASHNALTTARASNDAIGLNTALTAGPLAWTVNSSGLSLNAGSAAGTSSGFTGGASISGSFTHNTAGLAISLSHPAWLTTAAQSDHSHGNPTLALTNINGTTASNSAGLTLSLSAAGGGVTNQTGPNIAAGTQTATSGTVVFSNSNQITFGMSDSSVITASFNPINIGMSTNGNTAGTTGTFDGAGLQYVFAGGPGVTLSQSSNAASVTLSINAGIQSQRFQWPPGNLTIVAAMGNGSYSINRMQNVNHLTATRLDVPFYVSIASSATANTWGLRVTVFGAIYTKNGNTLSSLSSGSVEWSTSAASNSAGGTQIFPAAIRPLSIPMNVNMSVGEYYVGFGISTNTSSAGTATTALGNTWSVFGGPVYSSALGQVGDFTATTNTSTGLFGGQGVYSAAISTVPPTVSLSAINQTGSYYARGMIGLIFRNI